MRTFLKRYYGWLIAFTLISGCMYFGNQVSEDEFNGKWFYGISGPGVSESSATHNINFGKHGGVDWSIQTYDESKNRKGSWTLTDNSTLTFNLYNGETKQVKIGNAGSRLEVDGVEYKRYYSKY
jgi:hypothetical protein